MFILAAEMEENQENQTQTVETREDPQPEVGFPVSKPPVSQKGNKLPFVILGVVILLAVGGIFFLTRGSKEQAQPTETPQEEVTESPIPTASPEIDRSKVQIEVDNGTGITGEAAYLQGVLRSLGYTNVKVGNASSQNSTTTTVTFNSSVASGVVDELTAKLQEVYKDVTTKTSSSLSVDVLVVTGLRKGQTPKPSATAAPSASPTPTSTGSATPTPTPTST